MKILIVEDEHKTGDYLKQGLSEAGFVVVVFLTARDRVDERVKGLEPGADDYLVTPFWMTTSKPSSSARSGR